MRFGICASGHLGYTSVLALWERKYRLQFLFSDANSSELLTFAALHSIPCFIGNPRRGKGFDYLNQLESRTDLIISINYIFLLEKDIIFFPKYGCINLHGSLLPKYRGRSPHVWAIINNEPLTGITVHFIDEGCDTGNIVYQYEIVIEKHHTGGDILSIYEHEYPNVLEKTIALFLKDAPQGEKQAHAKATYFGKRIPSDGLINWNWQKERIFNWVRAQANPYPGAFCHYKDQKVTIDRIEFSDMGFNYQDKNGVVLLGGKTPVVKTPNGAIKIVKHRESIIFEEGILLE